MKRLVLTGLMLVTAMNAGCVKMTRVVINKDGKVTEEVTSWEPLIVVPMVAVVDGPVVYTDNYYRPPVVVYERPYYRSYSRGYYDHYPRRVHTIHIGGRSHHHRYRHWR